MMVRWPWEAGICADELARAAGTLGSAGASSGFWQVAMVEPGRRRRGRAGEGSIPRAGAFEVARQCLDLGRASWVRARVFRRIRGSVVERLGVRARALHETLGLGNLRRQAHGRHQIGSALRWPCLTSWARRPSCRAEDHAGGKDRRPPHDWSDREIALPDARLPSIHVTRRLRIELVLEPIVTEDRRRFPDRSGSLRRLVGDHERPMTSAAETAILPIDVEVQENPMRSMRVVSARPQRPRHASGRKKRWTLRMSARRPHHAGDSGQSVSKNYAPSPQGAATPTRAQPTGVSSGEQEDPGRQRSSARPCRPPPRRSAATVPRLEAGSKASTSRSSPIISRG